MSKNKYSIQIQMYNDLAKRFKLENKIQKHENLREKWSQKYDHEWELEPNNGDHPWQPRLRSKFFFSRLVHHQLVIDKLKLKIAKLK